jgi:hypothetical protein
MEQTSLDWYENELNKFEKGESKLNKEQITQEAKELFRLQIIRAAQYDPFLGDLPLTEGIHYYEKTFK